MLITCSVDMMLVVSQNSGGCPFHCYIELSQDWKCSEDPGRPGADFWKLVELRMGRKINWIVRNSKMIVPTLINYSWGTMIHSGIIKME